jgi:hypothetical protein
MGGEAGMGFLIEVGEGGTGDEVVDYDSSRCGSLVFRMGEPRGVMGVKIAYYQAVARYGDNVRELQGITWGAGGSWWDVNNDDAERGAIEKSGDCYSLHGGVAA